MKATKRAKAFLDALPPDVLDGFTDALADLVLAAAETEENGVELEVRSEPAKRSRRRRSERAEQEA